MIMITLRLAGLLATLNIHNYVESVEGHFLKTSVIENGEAREP